MLSVVAYASDMSNHKSDIDIQNSCYSAHQVPLSALTYLSTVSSSFCRTCSAHQRIAWMKTAIPSIHRASEVCRPDRDKVGNGSISELRNSASTSACSSLVANSELNLLLELWTLRMRTQLCDHVEICELIEVVMDLGRKPLARFSSGIWIILEQHVKHEDLRHAISHHISS